jgi:2-dehydropantoate 2-reductase
MKNSKILVYGAGVLGSLFAARLKEAGNDVSLLARGNRLADLREYGIVLEDAFSGKSSITQVTLVEQLRPDDAYDLVLVIMRKNQVPDILPELAANKNTPNIIFMTNNAAGADAYVESLGRERVLMGFPSAGGTRQGHVVRYIAEREGRKPTIPLGELDGGTTTRIIEIADLFRSAGFEIEIQTNIDAWLKYHVALVVPIAHAIYMAGGDNFKLAKTRDAIVLMVRGVREGFRVLQALNLPITPPNLKMFTWIPEPFMVAWASRMLDNELMELVLSQHANAAPDEMKFLADEFLHLVKQTNIATPALERLYVYSDPNSQPIELGSAQIPLDWRPIWLGTGVLVSVMLSTLLILSRRIK